MELQERFDELQGNYTSLQCQLSSCEEELLTIHGTLEEREREKEVRVVSCLRVIFGTDFEREFGKFLRGERSKSEQ